MPNLNEFLDLLPNIRNTPGQSIRLTYDDSIDVLYVNYRERGVASDSELTDDDVIVRYDGDEIIGMTILHASDR